MMGCNSLMAVKLVPSESLCQYSLRSSQVPKAESFNKFSIPLDPLLVKARHVDTILAVDGSCDTDLCWPNATSLRASYARAATLPDGQQILPYFPSAETFVDQGLNARPTFFGCNASQTEITDGMPLVV